MTSVFASAMDALFADPNIGVEAIYTSDGGAPVLVRVIPRRADAVTDFGDARHFGFDAVETEGVIRFKMRGRLNDLRLISIADSDSRAIEAIRQDRENCDLPPGAVRPTALAHAVVFGAPLAVLPDLPQLAEDRPRPGLLSQPTHRRGGARWRCSAARHSTASRC